MTRIQTTTRIPMTRSLGDDRTVRGARRRARREERRFLDLHSGLGARALLRAASLLG